MQNFHLIIDSEADDVISRRITAKRRQNDRLFDGEKKKWRNFSVGLPKLSSE